MLSYRHAFHAGNSADVLKHCVLVYCLDYLGRKEKPFFVVDTHAGAGQYTLKIQEKQKAGVCREPGREWESGIGRLLDAAGRPKAAAAGLPLLRRYLEALSAAACGGAGGTDGGARGMDAGGKTGEGVSRYAGSPALIRTLLGKQDRAALFELHPADFAALAEGFGGDRRFTARREDGLAGLRALLPPPQRRGCVFIDPSYELREDYGAVRDGLRGALRRFAAGLYIVWYPLLAGTDKPEKPGHEFAAGLLSLYPGNRCLVELRTGPVPERGMYGSGLVIFNPPWTLKGALEESMDGLAALLSGGRGDWGLKWEGRR
ncbi:MAG: 23S rRNA (adenine(2030)-N(6))-methyltransferase RlmJ [Treponema sp.]|jgi:23S rRNA (adenine2030-N6)-methyltransferase|nr:23S rRNA (adenine(2030)-N(6))-methyltransferase RlmJ [Treponema sp.]